jgi:putative membrane-bound dehydrogenase-like protein
MKFLARRRSFVGLVLVTVSSSVSSFELSAEETDKPIYDTQEITVARLSPEETVGQAKMPAGFRMQVAAKDPDVQQPIGMCWDSRGRLWIAENYTYGEKEVNFDVELNDRIVVLEDTDQDGDFDKRLVFFDKIKKLTSIEIGYGGVWVMAPPQLLFIPDQDRDDIPDASPVVVLDGFEAQSIRHNVANGLRWGRDGWLYGRHGIQAVSHVGVPGSSEIERTYLNCGIWRWHPTRKKFDVVCMGGTNSWGYDWDENGQLFYINTVIGHLWHAIPGAHGQRMYGEDRDPTVYELMSQVADHLHFDGGNEQWSTVKTKGISQATDAAGGGHAHVGMMIYQGEQWPAEYHGKLFTLNYHGRRINVERLERQGAGYVGKHERDMVVFPDPWFRGIELSAGPDGSVYVLDWSDIGECHDNDGIHRHSGVVFRIYHGESTAKPFEDLRAIDDTQLMGLIGSNNPWFAYQARLILAERSEDGTLSIDTTRELLKKVKSEPAKQRLAALWTLAGCGKVNSTLYKTLLADENEHVRIQMIHLIIDPSKISGDVTDELETMLESETSDLVRLHLAGAMQKIDGKRWWEVAKLLGERSDLSTDRDYPLMLWYAVKDRLSVEPDQAVTWLASLDEVSADKPAFTKIHRFASRYLSSRLPKDGNGIEIWLAKSVQLSERCRNEVVLGMRDGLLGRTKLIPPMNWEAFVSTASSTSDPKVREAILELQTLFGDGMAVEKLAAILKDDSAGTEARVNALRSMVDNRVPGTSELAWKFVKDRSIGTDAVAAILRVGSIEDARNLIAMLSEKGVRQMLVDSLVQSLVDRREFLPILFDAIESGRLPASSVTAASLRQMQLLGDPSVDEALHRLWPQTQMIGKDRIAQIQTLEAKLTPENLEAGVAGKGRATWNKLCASCHKLYGQGGLIGPELTGAQRSNLRYWTENVIDPSGTVADNYRVSLFLLDDGNLVTGVITAENEDTITVQTVKEKVTIETDTIEQRKTSTQSLMPEGLLDALDDEQRRDLFAYMMGSSQVDPE